ncbi:hypothetical protein HBI67_239410 [Parastagonospora nodorum]|nr:hypothetical protein HBI67_239410 [Parastagonospora nodorum]KAH6052137.1 hypothetical protein HBI66_239320 [Parastagonospora nodorum]
MCAKDNFIRQKSLLLISTSNYVNTFSLDFIFLFANILSLIAFIISYCLFADKLNIQQSLLDRATVILIIILVNKIQLLLILGDIAAYTLLARFIPTTKIYNPLLKKNAAKSRILLICADRQIRQCYLTICAILKHYNFNIYISLVIDTLHLLLKDLVIKMLDFITSLKRFNNKRAFTELIAIISLLFVLKAPFALHFIRVVCDLVILAQYKIYQRTLEEEKNFNYPKALDSICTRANSKAYYITIVKQFYSIINKKEYILQIYRTYSTRVIRPLPFCRLRYKVAANIAISNFTYAAAQFSSKRHNDSKHYNKKVLYLILIIIDYTYYDKDRKHIAYIKAFSKVLLFNNNRQINNTTRMLTFKFYDLSTIICLVHLILRDLPNLTTRTTISYYVNNYIN